MTSEFTIYLADRCETDDALLELTERVGPITTDCSVTVQHGETMLEFFEFEHAEPLGEALPALIGRLIDAGLTVLCVEARDGAPETRAIKEANAALTLAASSHRPALDAGILSKPVA